MEHQPLFDWDQLERKHVAELWTPTEIYEDVTADLLPKFIETEMLERKSAGIHAPALAIYVSMWANTPPDGGVIAVGVEDDGTLTGCSKKSESLIAIERQIRSDLVPDAALETKRVQITNKDGQVDFVIFYRVKYRHDKVVETNCGEAYIRRASSKHLLSVDEQHELKIERGQLSFELESCGLAWPEDFNLSAVRNWTVSVAAMKKVAPTEPVHQMLVRHRLGRMASGNFMPNNACALLFANDTQSVVPGCMLKFQRIEGDVAEVGSRRNVVKDIVITGTVPEIIRETGIVLETFLRTYSRLGKDGKFYTAPEYPEEAWQEAIVNACVHRSYSLRGMNIFVRMFDDRLQVDSPGGFPPFVTPETIYDIHHRRNWWLMDAMMYLQYVKCENEGAKRIRQAMLDMDLPAPNFEQKQIDGALVRVTLKNNHNLREKWIDSDVSEVIGAEKASTLTDYEKRIVNFAAEHGKINVSKAMQLMPKPRWHTAQKKLINLVAREILQHVSRYPRDPESHYVLYEAVPE